MTSWSRWPGRLPAWRGHLTAGGAFDWLADEPDLYTDADLVQPQAG